MFVSFVFVFCFFCFFFFLDKRSERAIIIHSHNELNITVNQHSILIYTGVTANCASLKSIHIISPWFLKKTITLNSFQINFKSQNFLNQFIYFFHKFLCHIWFFKRNYSNLDLKTIISNQTCHSELKIDLSEL